MWQRFSRWRLGHYSHAGRGRHRRELQSGGEIVGFKSKKARPDRPHPTSRLASSAHNFHLHADRKELPAGWLARVVLCLSAPAFRINASPRDHQPTPLPAALPLFAIGLDGLGPLESPIICVFNTFFPMASRRQSSPPRSNIIAKREPINLNKLTAANPTSPRLNDGSTFDFTTARATIISIFNGMRKTARYARIRTSAWRKPFGYG